MKDRFKNFAELSRHKQEGKDFSITARKAGGIAIVAPHAGSIEEHTAEIAQKIAANDHSLYVFKALKGSGGFSDMHITSTQFDEPKCLDLISASEMTITIHGCTGSDAFVYLGGLNEEMKTSLAAEFNKHGIRAMTEGHPFLATSTENICNKNRQKQGVQLEFSRGLRDNPDLRRKCAKIVRVYLKNYQNN